MPANNNIRRRNNGVNGRVPKLSRALNVAWNEKMWFLFFEIAIVLAMLKFDQVRIKVVAFNHDLYDKLPRVIKRALEFIGQVVTINDTVNGIYNSVPEVIKWMIGFTFSAIWIFSCLHFASRGYLPEMADLETSFKGAGDAKMTWMMIVTGVSAFSVETTFPIMRAYIGRRFVQFKARHEGDKIV